MFSFLKKVKKFNRTTDSYDMVVLIVGGSGHVGKAFVKDCKDMERVLFVNISPQDTISGSNTISIRADLTKNPQETIKKVLDLTGRIDVLVHMAAVYAFETAESLTPSKMKREFEVNTLMPLLVTQEVMRQYWLSVSLDENINQKRKVVVLGSKAGDGKTLRNDLIIYSSTKAALFRAWEYYDDFLKKGGIESIFLKPGAVQEKEPLGVFIKDLKNAVFR